MAIVSRKEFAEMCGDDVKQLNVYIARKKVMLHTDGKNIDTEDVINLLFKKQRQEHNKAKKSEIELVKHVTKNPRSNIDEEKSDNIDAAIIKEVFKDVGENNSAGGMQALLLKKLRGDAEYATVRAEKEKMLLAKTAGELLPIHLALDAHKIYMRSIVISFETAIENIANKFCHIMANGDMEMYTQIVEASRIELHRCVQDAGGETNRDIENLIKEFTTIRRKAENVTENE